MFLKIDHSLHLGNAKGLRNSVLGTGTENKYVFPDINHNITRANTQPVHLRPDKTLLVPYGRFWEREQRYLFP